jgi:hypothetical protein
LPHQQAGRSLFADSGEQGTSVAASGVPFQEKINAEGQDFQTFQRADGLQLLILPFLFRSAKLKIL